MFCASLLGVLELIMPDEKRYRCILTSVGAETQVTEGVMDATFSFVGYKHWRAADRDRQQVIL